MHHAGGGTHIGKPPNLQIGGLASAAIGLTACNSLAAPEAATSGRDDLLALGIAPVAATQWLKADPVYRQLDVSKQGRAVFVASTDTVYNAFSFITGLSLPFLLEELTPRLLAAVDGDPGTSTAQA